MALYSNIKEIAKKKKVTISQMELDCKLAQGSVCKWDKHYPSVEKVKKVADYLKVNINKLLKEEEQNERNKSDSY